VLVKNWKMPNRFFLVITTLQVVIFALKKCSLSVLVLTQYILLNVKVKNTGVVFGRNCTTNSLNLF